MSRHLWLVYERLGHPDAVSYPADEQDARCALELLSHPYARRLHLAGQLRKFLKQQERRPVFSRNKVPCRRDSGLYHLVPWRFAKWLSVVLPAEDAVIESTASRIRTWLKADGAMAIVNPLDGGA